MVSDYERQRLANIERNKALLNSLGLDKPFFEPEEVRRPKPAKATTSKKRKGEEHEDAPSSKAPRVVKSSDPVDAGGVRRSSRNAGKVVDYKRERQQSPPLPISFKSGIRVTENSGPLGRDAGSMRIHSPKSYGSIPGVVVGTWWETREACSKDAIHAPWVGGIAVGPQGAYSVALSGGYSDDVDFGYAFTYTGSGGRDLKGTKNKPLNVRALHAPFLDELSSTLFYCSQASAKSKKPVRVIRGFKLNSPYGPYEGYRYDGLYCVEKAWQEQGMEGFLVCKFAFKRLPGQPPLPRKAATEGSENASASNDVAEMDSDEDATAEDADADGESE
ncbi:E3 ubiquitin-protein ligase ORTHRUS 5 [Favolaschia claudopus]|uniref:E3 ubiquitin-protein ligase ORTHRUS 5 n=1 Tax=Favolaschia claudopus TaxID=2862362 RepID=A0AAW0EHI4_9AGAR